MKVADGDGYQDEAWDGAEWPIHRYRLLEAKDPALEGVDDRLRQAVAAVGGVFVPQEDVYPPVVDHTWNLADPQAVERFATAAQRVDVQSVPALETFVSTWGLLGTGLVVPGASLEPIRPLLESAPILRRADSLQALLGALRRWRRLVGQLQRLGPHDEAGWRAFTGAIQTDLCHALRWPTIGWDRRARRPVRRWAVQTPEDLLWIRLWDWATGGPMRECRRCGALFSRSDPRQRFCTVTCTNRASAAAHYRKTKREAARKKKRPRR